MLYIKMKYIVTWHKCLMVSITMFFRFVAKGKAQTWSSTWSKIQISRVSKAFKAKKLLVSYSRQHFQGLLVSVSHVSFASSNYGSSLCFNFCQKPEKHGIALDLATIKTKPDALKRSSGLIEQCKYPEF